MITQYNLNNFTMLQNHTFPDLMNTLFQDLSSELSSAGFAVELKKTSFDPELEASFHSLLQECDIASFFFYDVHKTYRVFLSLLEKKLSKKIAEYPLTYTFLNEIFDYHYFFGKTNQNYWRSSAFITQKDCVLYIKFLEQEVKTKEEREVFLRSLFGDHPGKYIGDPKVSEEEQKSFQKEVDTLDILEKKKKEFFERIYNSKYDRQADLKLFMKVSNYITTNKFFAFKSLKENKILINQETFVIFLMEEYFKR